MRRILSVTVAVAALAAAAAFTGAATAEAKTPALSALSRYVPFKDSALYQAKRAADLPDTWPFSELTATGETVRIHLSKRLYVTPDETVAKQWADFFDTLVHGPELATLDAYLLTLSQVQAVCGVGRRSRVRASRRRPSDQHAVGGDRLRDEALGHVRERLLEGSKGRLLPRR